MGIILGFFKALKLPIRLLKGWLRKKQKRKTNERERKLREYVYNFSEGRLKNVSWQKYDKKGKRKKKKA